MTRSLLAHKLSWMAVGCWLALILCAISAYAQRSDALIGKWNMVSSTSDGQDIPWTLTITGENGKYSAVATADGDNDAKDLKIEGSKVHFRIPYKGEEYDIDLRLDGDLLVGTWSGNDASGETKGHRAANPGSIR